MAQVSTNEFKAGMKLEIEGQPYSVISNEFVKPGKGQSFNRVRLKHLTTGRVMDKTFKSGDKADLADILETEMRVLYREQDGVVMMDEKSFEQVKIPFERVADVNQWLVEDRLYSILLYNGEIISVQPPTFMELKIVKTDQGDRGNTVSGRVLKPAELESGVTIQVPIFVKEGETIKVDTRTGEYVSRISA